MSNARTARLEAMLSGPILVTLIGLAWPNVLMMVAQASTGLVETWFISHLGVSALAGAAVVLPIIMLMQTMSQGAMGGGISSAIARALGAKDNELANRLVLHAVVLNAGLGVICASLLLLFRQPLFKLMGVTGDALDAAMAYSGVAFTALILMWIMNALASAIRGSGNMFVPAAVNLVGALLLVPISPCLIFGLGPFPALGIAGAGWAFVLYYTAGTSIFLWYCLSGRNLARLQRCPLKWGPMRNILIVGGFAMINPLLTNGLIASTTALVGSFAGTAALAGYGIAARLEYFIFPVAFGIGAPLVAMVASNLGAKQPERALKIALTGAALAFTLAEVVGLLAALWPEAWMSLFGAEPQMLNAGASFLRIVGPFFGFFSMGFALYFASQGAQRLFWPLTAGILRLFIASVIGWFVFQWTHSLQWFFAVSAFAMCAYGTIVATAVYRRTWFRQTWLSRPGAQ